MFAVDMPLLSQTHRGNSFVARLGGVGRGQIALGADMKCLRLAAYPKDLEGETAVVGREHGDAKLLKALVHSLLRESPSDPILHCGSEASLCGTEPRLDPDHGLPFALASRRPEPPSKGRLGVECKL
jgi:hypothetical protein